METYKHHSSVQDVSVRTGARSLLHHHAGQKRSKVQKVCSCKRQVSHRYGELKLKALLSFQPPGRESQPQSSRQTNLHHCDVGQSPLPFVNRPHRAHQSRAPPHAAHCGARQGPFQLLWQLGECAEAEAFHPNPQLSHAPPGCHVM